MITILEFQASFRPENNNDNYKNKGIYWYGLKLQPADLVVSEVKATNINSRKLVIDFQVLTKN